jgi:hypothetical protein
MNIQAGSRLLTMLNKKVLNSWWFRSLLMLATYVIAADLLSNLSLLLINTIGYLPYSDRPGPSWQRAHLPSGEELRFFAGYALLLVRGTALYGLIFSVSGLILGFCSLPRWALRVLAAPTAFLASGLVAAAAGWYIAISALGVWIAAGFGALWGLFVFPQLVPSMSRILPTPARIALPIMMWVGGTYCLIKPLLPDPGLTNAKIEVIRRDDSGTDLSKIDLSFVGPLIAGQAQGSGTYVSLDRMEFTTDGRNQVRVLLIIDDDRPTAHTFLLPRSGVVTYRQRQGKWNEERVEARNSEISLELTSDDGHEISLRVEGHCCSSMSERVGPYR